MSAAIPRAPVHADWKDKFDLIERIGVDSPFFTTFWHRSALHFRDQVRTLSLLGLFLGILYYLYLRMFQKAAVLLAANAMLMTSAQVWEASTGRSAPYLLSFLVYAFVPLYCCRFAARDYYLFCTKGSSFWEMPGSLGWLKRPRNTALAVTTTLVLCLVAIGMFPSPSDIMADMDGVWRNETDGRLVTLNLAGSKKSITIEAAGLQCKLRSADPDSSLIDLRCGDHSITLRQVWNTDNTAFRLGLRVDDGEQSVFDFVRPSS